MLNKKCSFWALILPYFLLLFGCANRQAITGGPRDHDPPKLLKATPPNMTRNFKAKTIQLDFDEYFKLTNSYTEITMSPTPTKNPEYKTSKKSLVINLKDSLEKNTTYVINFGKAIADVNEGNVLKNFTYVFSTGAHIDSLSMSGRVINTTTGEREKEATVMLFTLKQDSLLFGKKKPTIFTTTDTAGNFSLNNLHEGKYKIYALKELTGGNKIYDNDKELIAFNKKTINLQRDTSNIELKLFKETPEKFKILEKRFDQDGKLFFSFNKSLDNPSVKILYPPDFDKYKIAEISKTNDTATIYMRNMDFDSIRVSFLDNNKPLDTIPMRKGKKESFIRILTFQYNLTDLKLKPRTKLIATASYPIDTFDPSLVSLKEDSNEVSNFNIVKDTSDTRKFIIDYKWKQNANWENAIFRNAPVADYEISARGGTDKTKFFVGGSYYDQDGIIINNYYKRYNIRANIDNQATDRLSFGLNTSASYSDDKRSFNDNTYTGIVTNALGASPLMPVYSSPGVYADFTQYQAYWLSDNPVKSANEINAHTYTDRFISSLFAEYKIMKDLKFKSTWSIDYNDVNDNQFFSALTVDAQAVGGKLLLGESKTMTWLNENTFNYQHKFGKNNLTLLAGYSQQQSKIELSQGGGEGFPGTGDVQNINNAATPIVVIIPYPLVYDALRSFISRANYDYDGKYLLSFIMRADGSSKFAPGHQWGYFPSASLGWNIGDESFLRDNKSINSLKLRASYGLSGDQDNVPSYQDYAYWGAAKYNGDAGFVPYNILGPAPLTWQTNKTFNIGTDFELFNHFINGSIEYFISDETKLLNQEQIPGTTGFQWAYANSGKIEDKGLEIQLNTNNIKSRDFTWTSSFNISFLKNTIKSLAVDNQYVSSYNDQSPTNILKVGQPVGTFIGVRFTGVNPANGDALYYAADGTKERADQVNFTRDATVIGNARPKFFGGFTNEFKYKKFDALISTQFTYGNKVFNLIRTTYESLGWSSASTPSGAYLGGVYANNDTRVLGAWSHPGQITNIPRPSFLLQNYFPNSDEFLEDGSFLKIRTVNIGYTIGKTKYFNSIRLYVQAENLLTISNYIGFDPEVSSTGGANAETAGIDYAAYPPARTFSLGVDVKF